MNKNAIKEHILVSLKCLHEIQDDDEDEKVVRLCKKAAVEIMAVIREEGRSWSEERNEKMWNVYYSLRGVVWDIESFEVPYDDHCRGTVAFSLRELASYLSTL